MGEPLLKMIVEEPVLPAQRVFIMLDGGGIAFASEIRVAGEGVKLSLLRYETDGLLS